MDHTNHNMDGMNHNMDGMDGMGGMVSAFYLWSDNALNCILEMEH